MKSIKNVDRERAFYNTFKGTSTLYIIDDCSATKAITKKKDMLSELAFSGRLALTSVWIVTLTHNSIHIEFREHTWWVSLFHYKDQDSFEDCLCGNDIIPSKE